MLKRSALYLIIISFVIAAPVAWYFSDQWLDRFVFKTELGWLFRIAGSRFVRFRFLIGFRRLAGFAFDLGLRIGPTACRFNPLPIAIMLSCSQLAAIKVSGCSEKMSRQSRIRLANYSKS